MRSLPLAKALSSLSSLSSATKAKYVLMLEANLPVEAREQRSRRLRLQVLPKSSSELLLQRAA